MMPAGFVAAGRSTYHDMRFLVTGGTGFIGSYVVRCLLQHGERAVCFDRSPDLEVMGLFTSQVEVIAGDVGDRQQVAGLYDGGGVGGRPARRHAG
jgi:nucleoside-diphosphate-sugar epimerase